jgi:hypothetical protein
MYEHNNLGDMGDTGSIPAVGFPVTVTLAVGSFFDFTWDSTILSKLTNDLNGMATIVSAERPLASGHLVVVFVPQISMTQEDWINTFIVELQSLGYDKASLVLFEVGKTESSSPGGSSEIITTTTGKVAQDVVKPLASGAGNILTSGLAGLGSSLWPVLLVAVALGGGYLYVTKPQLFSARRT